MNHDDAWVTLDDYLDGALAADARWAVAAHLSDCAECQQHVAQRARVREIVRDHARTIEPPPGLDDRLRAALAAEPDWSSDARPLAWLPPRALRVAAVLGPIAAGLILLIRALAPIPVTTPDLKAELVIAHALFAQDTSKLDVEGDAVTVESWFRDEIGLGVSAPDIDGYRLSGARLIAMDGQPVAQVVYRSIPDGIYLSFLRFKDGGVNLDGTEEADGFAAGQQGPTSFVTWESGGDRTVLIGEAPLPELRGLASNLAGQLGPLPTAAAIEIRVVPSSSSGGAWSDYP